MTLLCNSISFCRVCRDFWIQNSRFFPHFFKNCNFFFQTQVYQRGEQYRSFKKQEQSFTNNTLQMYRQDWMNFDQHEEKNFTCKALDVAFKKLLTIFSDFISIFQTFHLFDGQIPRFLKNSTLYINPIFFPLKFVWKSILLTAVSLEDLNSFSIIEVYQSSNYNICSL